MEKGYWIDVPVFNKKTAFFFNVIMVDSMIRVNMKIYFLQGFVCHLVYITDVEPSMAVRHIRS